MRHDLVFTNGLALLAMLAAPALATPTIRQCLTTARITETRIPDDTAILYRIGSQWYRSEVQQRCPNLGPRAGIASKQQGSQICANDPFQVFAPGQGPGVGIQLASCSYGPFTAIDPPPPATR